MILSYHVTPPDTSAIVPAFDKSFVTRKRIGKGCRSVVSNREQTGKHRVEAFSGAAKTQPTWKSALSRMDLSLSIYRECGLSPLIAFLAFRPFVKEGSAQKNTLLRTIRPKRMPVGSRPEQFLPLSSQIRNRRWPRREDTSRCAEWPTPVSYSSVLSE